MKKEIANPNQQVGESEKIFTLDNPIVTSSIQKMDEAFANMYSQYEIAKAKYEAIDAKLGVLRSSIFTYFRAHAVFSGNLTDEETQDIEVLPEFKYKIVPKQQQMPISSQVPVALPIEDKEEEV